MHSHQDMHAATSVFLIDSSTLIADCLVQLLNVAALDCIEGTWHGYNRETFTIYFRYCDNSRHRVTYPPAIEQQWKTQHVCRGRSARLQCIQEARLVNCCELAGAMRNQKKIFHGNIQPADSAVMAFSRSVMVPFSSGGLHFQSHWNSEWQDWPAKLASACLCCLLQPSCRLPRHLEFLL